jgi:spore coat polysaccharide biosynthesis protein SpsF
MTTEELNAAIIIQARMSSTRLPGKTMMPLAGRRMIYHVASRFAEAPVTGPLVVATSNEPSDDFIHTWTQGARAVCFRGSERDVLDRFRGAAEHVDSEYIVRATADNPLTWEGAIEHLGRHMTEQGCDYISHTRHMPLGLGLEMFTRDALFKAHDEAKQPHQREHVTPYFYENQDIFDCLWISPPKELEGDYRLTVDTKEDLELMREIYDRLYTPGSIIPAADAVQLLRDEPKLAAINSEVRQKRFTEHEGGEEE